MIITNTDIHAALRYRRKTFCSRAATWRVLARQRRDSSVLEGVTNHSKNLRTLGLGGTACMPCASTATAIGPLDPLSFLGMTPQVYFQADVGVTQSGGQVSQWDDQSPSITHGIQATGGAQPLITTADATLGNRASILGDGVDDSLNVGWNVADPDVAPTFVAIVFRAITWGTARNIWGSASNVAMFIQTVSSPGIRFINVSGIGTPVNNGAPVGVWTRGFLLFNNMASDYLTLAGTTTTGTATGGNNPNSIALFSRVGNAFANVAIAHFSGWGADFSSGQKTAFDSWVTSWTSGAVAIA